MRLHKLLKYVDFNDKVIVDVGCGYNALSLQYIKKHFSPKKLIAVDLHLNTKALEADGIECIEMDLEQCVDIGKQADIVIATAIIEHIVHAREFVTWIHNTLVPKGALLVTVPSVWAQPVLEFMAYRLHIISEQEIRDHKDYYDKKKIVGLLESAGFVHKNIKHSYFQFFMNNFVYAQK